MSKSHPTNFLSCSRNFRRSRDVGDRVASDCRVGIVSHTTLAGGAEFDSIRAMLEVWGNVATGIGDDAAILTPPGGQQLVISTDASVEDVHFRFAWMTLEQIGERASAAALSDIAAMGARADSVLVSIITPASLRDQLPSFARGVKHTVERTGARIVGGNIALGEKFSCTFTVLGYTDRPVRRTGAAAGDVLCVTGTLGGPRAALEALELGATPPDWALERFLHPSPRLDEGLWLAMNGASAMIDISDGLGADAGHLAAANGLAAHLEPELVPRFTDVTPMAALQSGEEYELLVAIPDYKAASTISSFEATFRRPLTRVGQLAEAADHAPDGSKSIARVELPVGHDHFSNR